MQIEPTDIIYRLLDQIPIDTLAIIAAADRAEELGYPYIAHSIRHTFKKRWLALHHCRRLFTHHNLQTNKVDKLINKLYDGKNVEKSYKREEISQARKAIAIAVLENIEIIKKWLKDADESETTMSKWIKLK